VPFVDLSPARRWVERPQSVWLRRAFFQVHLWTGILAGLYIVAVSISGSALVLSHHAGFGTPARTTAVAPPSATALDPVEIERRARQAYPSREVLAVVAPRKAGQPYGVIWLVRNKRVEGFFDPYTGTDLGDSRSRIGSVLNWLADLHDNLLSGLTGRIVNGVGALLLVLMSLTGAVIWWPGVKNWRRSTNVQWSARPARLNWDLHSAVGFWCYLFVLIWGVSGIQLCFPGTLDFLLSSRVRFWITSLHFGRFNEVTEAIWTVLGLVPAFLAVTGALMWWNRVLSKKISR